jgi:hypothetical protein
MPRSGGGIYSKGSPSVVSGTTIQSAAYNTTIDDLVTDANAARPVSAGGTGAANAADARTNLGATVVGAALFTAVDAAAARTAASAAALVGSSTQAFDVGDATTTTHALNSRTGDARYAKSGGGLSISAGSGALTIALTDAAGATPTASTGVPITFRSATTSSGATATRTVTAATTLTITSGSTMGFANGVAGRLWIVAFDDAGTVRLGAINCRNGVSVFRLMQFGIASSTAEGGAGAADSAHVFYTGTATTAKAYTVLGYLEWPTGLATAGTWTWGGSERAQPYVSGMRFPGDIIQMRTEVNSTYSSNNASAIPIDNTIPQNTEGSAISTIASFSPSSPANVLRVETCGTISSAFVGSSVVGVSVCRSDQSDAIVATGATFTEASSLTPVIATAQQVIGASSAFDITNRYGPQTATFSATINGTTARFFGAAQAFSLTAFEVMA